MARTPKKIEIVTKAQNGKLSRNRDLIQEAVKAFEGKDFRLIFARLQKPRSNKQNRYYFGVIVEHWKNIIHTEWAELWSSDEVHHFLKSNLNFEEVMDEETGMILRRPKSTTENSTGNQEDYHKACRDLAYQMFDYQIPLPNEEVEITH